MRTVLVKYRIKLNVTLVLQTPLFNFMNEGFPDKDCDMQILDMSGNVILPFSNLDLNPLECYEGVAQITFKGNIKDHNLKYYIYNGSCSIDSFDDLELIMQLERFVIYKNNKGTDYYLVSPDLQEIPLDIEDKWRQMWPTFLLIFSDIYGSFAPAVAFSSFNLSDDRRIAKFQVYGLHYGQIAENRNHNLNRILPS